MFTANRIENPNVATAHLLQKYMKARRIKPLVEINGSYGRDPKKPVHTAPRPTKYQLRALDGHVYIYFSDGSLRRVEKIVGNLPVFRTRGKAKVKAAKRARRWNRRVMPTLTRKRWFR